jgi:hypothetical protein
MSHVSPLEILSRNRLSPSDHHPDFCVVEHPTAENARNETGKFHQRKLHMKCRNLVLLVTIFVSLHAITYAAKHRTWQDGTLKNIEEKSYSSRSNSVPFSGDVASHSVITFEFTIETADRFYVATYTPPPKWGGLAGGVQKNVLIDVDINGSVKFAIEKAELFLNDRNGKEYKLHVLKQGIRTKS